MKSTKKFGLFTSVCMIVGVVIGSGIFFKCDLVLTYTNGNIGLGVLSFVLAAMAIVFGSLTVAELALRSNKVGGIIDYIETYSSSQLACGLGWFQCFVYFPANVAVIAHIATLYIEVLFGWHLSLEASIGLTFGVIFFIYTIHYYSTQLAGLFQNAATIIKLVPLCLVIVYVLFEHSITVSGNGLPPIHSSNHWFAAVGPVAFAYDGWIIATGMSHVIKDSKRNLPLALIIAPIFILCMYVAYFVAASTILGPARIVALGKAHVYTLFNVILGPLGSKFLMIFVIVSVLGTLNGFILASGQGFYVLGVKKMVPKSKQLAHINKLSQTPMKSILFAFIISTFWLLIHYVTSKFTLLDKSDVSEITVIIFHLLFIILYIQVIKFGKKGIIKNPIRCYIIPGLAILGSLFIFFGGMNSLMSLLYSIAFIAIMWVGSWYFKYQKRQEGERLEEVC